MCCTLYIVEALYNSGKKDEYILLEMEMNQNWYIFHICFWQSVEEPGNMKGILFSLISSVLIKNKKWATELHL